MLCVQNCIENTSEFIILRMRERVKKGGLDRIQARPLAHSKRFVATANIIKMASSSLNFLLLFSVCGVLTTTVSAIPVEDFYPYGLSAGDNLLNRTLDGSSPNIITPSQLKIFGRYFSEIFVSRTAIIIMNVTYPGLLFTGQ